jgi:hypothetical protein
MRAECAKRAGNTRASDNTERKEEKEEKTKQEFSTNALQRV